MDLPVSDDDENEDEMEDMTDEDEDELHAEALKRLSGKVLIPSPLIFALCFPAKLYSASIVTSC